MFQGRTPTSGTGLRKKVTPAGLPGSTFVRPASRSGPTGMQQIASALGSLAPALQQVVNKQKENDNDFIIAQSAKSPADFRKAVAENPRLQVRAGHVVLGQKEAEDYSTHLSTWMAEYNPEGDQDIHSFLAEKRTAWAENLPNDAAKASFVKTTERMHERIIAGYNNEQAVQVGKDMDQGITFQMRGTMTAAIEAGKTPDQAMGEVMKVLTANKQMLGLPKDRQSALLFSFATELAARGRPDLAEAVLKNKRGGTAPSLMDDPQYSVKAVGLIEKAHLQSVQNFQRENTEGMSEAQEAIDTGTFHTEDNIAEFQRKYPNASPWLIQKWKLRSEDKLRSIQSVAANKARTAAIKAESSKAETAHGVATLQDLMEGRNAEGAFIPNAKDGAVDKWVDAQAAEKLAVRLFNQGLDGGQEKLRDQGATPEQITEWRTNAEIKFHTKAPAVLNDNWKADLSNLNVSALPQALVDGKVPDRVERALDLYETLRVRNPALANTHTSGDDAEFLDVYYTLRDANMGRQEALTRASQWATNKGLGIEPDRAFRIKDDDLRSSIRSSMTGLFGSEWSIDINTHDIETIRKQVKTYMRAGLDQDQALDAAGEWFQTKHVNINGTPVWMGNAAVPKDTPANVEVFFQDLVKNHGKDLIIDDPDNLIIRPINRDAYQGWIVMEKDATGLMRAVQTRDGRFVRITPNDIGKITARIEKDDALRLERERRSKMRRNNPEIIPGPTRTDVPDQLRNPLIDYIDRFENRTR